MSSNNTLPHESRIYSTFARFYDGVFERLFTPRIFKVVSDLEIEERAKVLEVGVGTGLSLGAYPSDCDYVGVDLAPDMLSKARQKARHLGLDVQLRVANALELPFDDNSFDYVTSFHVVSVVPDAQQMVRELCRVCRPDGQIAIINHFRSPRPKIARWVDRLDPLTRKFGWRTTLGVEDLTNEAPFVIDRRYKTSKGSLYTILIGRSEYETRH